MKLKFGKKIKKAIAIGVLIGTIGITNSTGETQAEIQSQNAYQVEYTAKQKDLNKINEKIQDIKDNYNDQIEGSALNDEMLELSDEEVWSTLTNGVLDSRPEEMNPTNASETQEAVSQKITTIEVKVRGWKGDTGLEREDKIVKIEVNEELADMWKGFFNDIYEEAPDFVISELGGYRLDSTSGGQVGAKSGHNYGAAIDINATQNYYNKQPLEKEEWEALPETRGKYEEIYKGSKVSEIADRYTLSWGGDWINLKDNMHISYISDYTRAELTDRLSGVREEALADKKEEFFNSTKEEIKEWAKTERIGNYQSVLNELNGLVNGEKTIEAQEKGNEGNER